MFFSAHMKPMPPHSVSMGTVPRPLSVFFKKKRGPDIKNHLAKWHWARLAVSIQWRSIPHQCSLPSHEPACPCAIYTTPTDFITNAQLVSGMFFNAHMKPYPLIHSVQRSPMGHQQSTSCRIVGHYFGLWNVYLTPMKNYCILGTTYVHTTPFKTDMLRIGVLDTNYKS